jgi:UDP-N-acetylmuramate--alanine ligase
MRPIASPISSRRWPVPAPEQSGRLDLAVRRTIHIVGVAGHGMSALAAVLAELGHTVSGTDLAPNRRMDRLGLLGVTCTVGQRAENVPADCDAVVISTAVPRANVEVAAAEARGIAVYHRSDALAGVVAARRGIGVAGTHGKTTTSSMVTLILRAAGLHPSFVIGSELHEVGTNAAMDSGEWLVVESDESDGSFLKFDLDAAIVTNVEEDHLGYWGTMARLEAAFEVFASHVEGPVVLCADDPVTARMAAVHPRAVTYGWAEDAEFRAVDYRSGAGGSRFTLLRSGEALGAIALPLLGSHNAQNATAAAALAMRLGVDFPTVRDALAGFGGVSRRFQFRGERDGVTYVDDYAHLPSEIRATVRAAHEGGWNRIVAVFQPYRYKRTQLMWREFADAFEGVDHLVLTDVCGASEEPIPGVTGRLVLRAVLDAHPDLPVTYLPHRAELVAHVPRYARPGDLVLTLGAGDLTTVPDEWVGG